MNEEECESGLCKSFGFFFFIFFFHSVSLWHAREITPTVFVKCFKISRFLEEGACTNRRGWIQVPKETFHSRK